MKMKTIGIKRVVGEYKRVPYGFHVEIWGRMRRSGDVEVWTTDYLSQNCWTINHREDEHKLDGLMREYMEEDGLSMTDALKKAVAETWRD